MVLRRKEPGGGGEAGAPIPLDSWPSAPPTQMWGQKAPSLLISHLPLTGSRQKVIVPAESMRVGKGQGLSLPACSRGLGLLLFSNSRLGHRAGLPPKHLGSVTLSTTMRRHVLRECAQKGFRTGRDFSPLPYPISLMDRAKRIVLCCLCDEMCSSQSPLCWFYRPGCMLTDRSPPP